MDLTTDVWLAESAAYLIEAHTPALAWIFVYTLVKLVGRLFFENVSAVWDRVCLAHNGFSVLVGCWTIHQWSQLNQGIAGTCGDSMSGNLSRSWALIMLLQFAHGLTDFFVFLPEMIRDPVFVCHHGILVVAATILPNCPGCFFVVIAVTIAEFGSGAIAVDAEWRKAGGQSRGLKRLVFFGGTRIVNLVLLYQIWLVTPMVHEFTLHSEGALVFKVNVPICMITSVGGSALMLCVNGLTWWRMFLAYLKHKDKRMSAMVVNTSA